MDKYLKVYVFTIAFSIILILFGKLNVVTSNLFSTTTLFGTPVGKVDDWQFTPSLGSSSFSNPIDLVFTFFATITFERAGFALLATTVGISLILSIHYIYYRFLGALIRIFKKNTTFGTKKKLLLAFFYVILGILFIIGTIYFSKINNNLIYIPITVLIAATLTLLGLIIYSGIYLIINLFRKIKAKKQNLGKYPMKRHLLISFTTFSLGFSVVGLFIFFQIVNSTIGYSSYGSNSAGLSNVTAFGGSPSVAPLGASAGMGISLDSAMPAFKATSENIGFSAGGAKDINNFRENIKNKYLPLVSDITYEGLFYDYYFDTGQQKECTNLFCPAYSYAYSEDPISNQPEHYLSVGLNSGIKESDFHRKKLNLVIVLDISGSMSSSFNRYYYDQFGNTKTNIIPSLQEQKSKMLVAKESLVALTKHLNEDDSLGIVLFDSNAYLAKPLRRVSNTDMNSIREHIMEIPPQGSTNMEAGYKMATQLLDEYKDASKDEYENRIIFLTDAQPNTGNISEDGLTGMTETNSENGIYTTFIGIGVDFNTELIELITKTKGANYYSVHSSQEFSSRMDEGFEYMVTPLVFDLELKVDSPDFDIQKVYGSPEANEATGEILKVNTLFPSDNDSGEVKGGIILVKLKPVRTTASEVTLTASYKDRNGTPFEIKDAFKIPTREVNTYDNLGIRKGILLARYANLIKNWVADERKLQGADDQKYITISGAKQLSVGYDVGITIPTEDLVVPLGRWERQSTPLNVMPEYKEYISKFREYFDQESIALDDKNLDTEKNVLDLLSLAN